MSDRPILFSGPMVRALLAGTRTQTRRVLDMPPMTFDAIFNDDGVWHIGDAATGHRYAKLPVRYRVADRLYVREAWRSAAPLDDTSPRDMDDLLFPPVRYEADGEVANWREWRGHDAGRLRQGMHMPRWASRLTLTVTDVRIQRVQEISEADAAAEGLEQVTEPLGDDWRSIDTRYRGADYLPWLRDPIEAYADLWDQLNDARGYGWSTNPWVTATSFTVALGNIDQVAP